MDTKLTGISPFRGISKAFFRSKAETRVINYFSVLFPKVSVVSDNLFIVFISLESKHTNSMKLIQPSRSDKHVKDPPQLSSYFLVGQQINPIINEAEKVTTFRRVNVDQSENNKKKFYITKFYNSNEL